jgi:hypothetical protein
MPRCRSFAWGGPVYAQISPGKGLVADILPPPEYVLESCLEASLALQDPADLAQQKARLARLHKDLAAVSRLRDCPGNCSGELS